MARMQAGWMAGSATAARAEARTLTAVPGRIVAATTGPITDAKTVRRRRPEPRSKPAAHAHRWLRAVFATLHGIDVRASLWRLRSRLAWLPASLPGRRSSLFLRVRRVDARDPMERYWQAEVWLDGQLTPVTVTGVGRWQRPTVAEERFCRELLSDPDALFARCQRALSQQLGQMRQTMPSRWTDDLELDALSVPLGGLVQGAWDACYYHRPTRHYLTVQFDREVVSGLRADA